jgi:serine/threonine protein kinase
LIKGDHNPKSVGAFTSVIEQLHFMHDDGIVHGDIRIFNIIFTEDGKSQLIDFDFAGVANEQRYPHGFAFELDDVERHPMAKAGGVLCPEHDSFSLASIMKKFELSDKTLESFWKEAILCLEKNELEKAVEILHPHSDDGIKVKDDALSLLLASYSGNGTAIANQRI